MAACAPRVLGVDDEATIRDIVRRYLAAEGFADATDRGDDGGRAGVVAQRPAELAHVHVHHPLVAHVVPAPHPSSSWRRDHTRPANHRKSAATGTFGPTEVAAGTVG